MSCAGLRIPRLDSAIIVTWDGGGAHANPTWNEELVRTEERERERERERECFIQGQFGTDRVRQRVWHVIFI